MIDTNKIQTFLTTDENGNDIELCGRVDSKGNIDPLMYIELKPTSSTFRNSLFYSCIKDFTEQDTDSVLKANSTDKIPYSYCAFLLNLLIVLDLNGDNNKYPDIDLTFVMSLALSPKFQVSKSHDDGILSSVRITLITFKSTLKNKLAPEIGKVDWHALLTEDAALVQLDDSGRYRTVCTDKNLFDREINLDNEDFISWYVDHKSDFNVGNVSDYFLDPKYKRYQDELIQICKNKLSNNFS